MRMAGLRQRPLAGGRASLELLATRPPAVLLRSAYRRGERSLGQSWLDHPLAKPKRSRIVTVDGRPWTCAGPLMLGEVQRLRRML
jgi:iron complex transport system substrate-binding protein